jgi:putative membrane protein insertion efficiency factor
MKITYIPRRIAQALVLGYQKTLSPDHGLLQPLFPYGYCKYHPSCSEYTYQALGKYGLIKGLVLGSWRVLRCNPWSKGGDDPLT